MTTKRKPDTATRAKAVKAKRRKTSAKPKAKKAAPVLNAEEKFQKMSDHVNMCVARVNLLMQHTNFIQKKMYELATTTNRQFSCFHFELEELRSAAQKTCIDAYELFPGEMLTDTETTLDGEMMSEEMLIQAVGEFADSLP